MSFGMRDFGQLLHEENVAEHRADVGAATVVGGRGDEGRERNGRIENGGMIIRYICYSYYVQIAVD